MPPKQDESAVVLEEGSADGNNPNTKAYGCSHTSFYTDEKKKDATKQEDSKDGEAKEETDKDSKPAASEAADTTAEAKSSEDEKKSIEDAAAEAGLAVIQTSDDSPTAGLPSDTAAAAAATVTSPETTAGIMATETPLAAGTPLAPEESPYPYHINSGKDVISGKGGKVQQYNRHFRNLVAESYPAYDATTSKIAKRRIGVAIYTTIVEKGGRFLDANGKEMDRSKAVLKIMKALKVFDLNLV